MKKKRIIVILGPTSSGKTALSIALAKKIGGEIISADSRQVYRGLTIGTGKVTEKEMDGIPHHLLDVANPKKQFSVALYKELADQALQEIFARGAIPIVCGGTGFYIDSLTTGIVIPEVAVNTALRKKLTGLSAEQLLKQLKKLDPARAKTIEQQNPVRLMRAIEIALALGKVPKLKKKKLPYEVLKIGLDMPDEILKKRINLRLSERINSGMLHEAQSLHAQGLSWRRMHELGLEYRAMASLLTGKITKEDFEKNLALDIWHYAKRQRVWFKRDKEIHWFNPLKKSDLKKVESLVKKYLAE